MKNNRYHISPSTVEDEVRLRHMTVDEALLKLDKYLNDAFMAGYREVRVIHGKGGGTLREAVRRELNRHALVKSFRPGGYREGGAGVSIAELSDR